VVDHHHRFPGGCSMSWTKPEFEVVELGMEVGAYAGNA
jgi:coenzyme PQQ precursor peptide PqqA